MSRRLLVSFLSALALAMLFASAASSQSINTYTFATLPGSPTPGQLAWITDNAGTATEGSPASGGALPGNRDLVAYDATQTRWEFVMRVPATVPAADLETYIDAVRVSYDNATSGATAENVQAALDELFDGGVLGTDDQTATEVPFTSTIAGWASANVRAALDSLYELAGEENVCWTGLIRGGRIDAQGRYGWTCGIYNWHGWRDATQATSSYAIDCTGDGTGNLPGGGSAGVIAQSCLRDSETRYVGYVIHRIAIAAQYTRDGGRVYIPAGIYVDRGAGLKSDGVTRAKFPTPYDPSWESRADFATLGYPTSLRTLVINRGVRLIGEGIPQAITYDPNDATVTENLPKISGTWLVDDRGNAADTPGASGPTLDGLAGNISPIGQYRVLVGGILESSYCHTTSNSDPACDRERNFYNQAAPNGANLWGAHFPLLANLSTAAGVISACIPDTDWTGLGTSQTDAAGTCSGNRQIRCWDQTGAADVARASGGCDFGGANDFGVCEAPYEALVRDYVTNGGDLQIGMALTECPDNATSSADCATPLGYDLYAMEFRNDNGSAFSPASSCASGAGTSVHLGNAGNAIADFGSSSIPFPNFFIGGTGSVNRVFPIRRGALDGRDAGFEGLGRMPGNWLTRNSATAAADCLSGGDADNADDEAPCDTDTLAGFSMSFNNRIGPNNLFFKASQALGNKSAVVETAPSGGPNYFIGNTIDTHYRQTVIDWGEGVISDNTARNLSAWVGKYGWMACYSGSCVSERNFLENSVVDYGYLSFTAHESLTVRDEVYSNVNAGGPFFWIMGGKRFLAEGIRFNQLFGNFVGYVNPGGVHVQKPDVVFRDISGNINTFGLASNVSTGGGIPIAAFVTESDDAASANPDDFKRLVLDGINLRSLNDDLCLLWVEDDVRGTSGPVADGAALNREAASRITVRDSNVIGTGGGSDNPAIACTGQYEYIAAITDADQSDSWAFEAFAPSLIGNQINNLPVPDMVRTISEVGLDADNLPDGTIIRIHDGSSTACAHTSGDLTAGSSVATCVSDPGTSGSATDGTWVPL